MAYRRKGDESYRQKGKINPYLQEIRLRGHDISSDDFWKVVKRYQRFNTKLVKVGLSPINVFSETLTYFTNPQLGFERIRVNTLQVRDRRFLESQVIAKDLASFRMKYNDLELGHKIPLGDRKEWLEWMQLTYNNPNLTYDDLTKLTLDDFFIRFATDEKFKKRDLYKAINQAKVIGGKSPKYLGIGS